MSGHEVEVPPSVQGRMEAVKTYMEQTKLLITLASGFIIAPPALKDVLDLAHHRLAFVAAEGSFIVSVLCGYLVFATIAGDQHKGKYNVHRCATKVFSLIQFFILLVGIGAFVIMAWPAMLESKSEGAATQTSTRTEPATSAATTHP